MTTIENCLGKGSNRYNKIRRMARAQCEKDGRLTKCECCGWDKHVEVGHIKPISNFPADTDISIVNHKENLIVLCPNCHWVNDHPKTQNKKICECGMKKHRNSLHCKNCANKFMKHYRKVERPSREELIVLINQQSFLQLGRQFGVSGNAIKKWCKFYEIETGNRIGFWQKKRCKVVGSADHDTATTAYEADVFPLNYKPKKKFVEAT